MIDTAAYVNVMIMNFFEIFKPKPLLQREIMLKDAGKNNIINGRIEDQVKLRIRPTERRWVL